ncbi:MAG: HipA domain-containing protein [Micrococcales bacterium]|nr:HipA domain-containing protein [Micrococcales bacterium]OJX67708.1 MAG: toxin-antitoxin system, toxin component [Micrococcales bacterium 72-143]
MPELAVDLYGVRVGTLRENSDGFDFVADTEGMRAFGAQSTVLSVAVPLTDAPRPRDRAIRRNFFDELLPEGRARARLAGNARIRADYTIGMLARYGRDVAGAVRVWDPLAPGEPRTPAVRPASAARIRELIAEVRNAPIGNDSVRRLSSLAGVQDKFVLAWTPDGWTEPLDGFPSTHIVKPVVPERPSLIFDEEYGSRIARHLGLADFDTDLQTFDGHTALVIERYDRGPELPDGRLHQEDFNQALGFSGDGKYESWGHPGLGAIAALLRSHATRAALADLLRYTTLSIAVGNLDMHAKNLSIVHRPDGSTALAPIYDVVPQLHLVDDHDFAFRVNGRFGHAEITADDLVAEGSSWGLRDAAAIVDDILTAVGRAVELEQPSPGAHPALQHDIRGYVDNLLSGRGASARPGPGSATEPRALPESPGGWGGPVAP